MTGFPDFRPTPRPDLHEIENQATDPDGLVLDAMRSLAPWGGRTLVDLGCGSGYWLPVYAASAGRVIGVEPDPALLPLAAARSAAVTVLPGSAEQLPLGDASVDVVHARFAYFRPPAGQRGLSEVMRVLRPGGTLVVVDNDMHNGEFASLLDDGRRGLVTDSWWAERGAVRREVMSRWSFPSRADLEAVLHLEFPHEVAASWLAAHPGVLGLSYGYVLFAATRP